MENTARVIEQAIENEIIAKVFYDKAAELTNVGESQMVFMELATMEDEHASILVERFGDLLKAAGVETGTLLQKKEQATEDILNVEESELIKNGDMRSVIKHAIALEIVARDNYLGLSTRVEDEKAMQYCKDLAAEEQKHHDMLTDLLSGVDMSDDDRPML
jgi:rubrerythrin